jgi:hypothetical protein
MFFPSISLPSSGENAFICFIIYIYFFKKVVFAGFCCYFWLNLGGFGCGVGLAAAEAYVWRRNFANLGGWQNLAFICVLGLFSRWWHLATFLRRFGLISGCFAQLTHNFGVAGVKNRKSLRPR